MSNLVTFDAANLGSPREGSFAAERTLEGAPSYKVWEMENCREGQIRSGIWEATPGSFRVEKGENWEYCTILSGIVELTEEGGETHRFTEGDTFVMRPGLLATWKTIKTVRKLWVIVS